MGAKNKIIHCQQRIKAQKEKEKRTFANMFDKFAMADRRKEDMERKKMPDAMNHIDQWNSGGDASINTDPNSIKVGGDIQMSMTSMKLLRRIRRKRKIKLAAVS